MGHTHNLKNLPKGGGRCISLKSNGRLNDFLQIIFLKTLGEGEVGDGGEIIDECTEWSNCLL